MNFHFLKKIWGSGAKFPYLGILGKKYKNLDKIRLIDK